MYAASKPAIFSEIVLTPPRMTIDCGWSRMSSCAVAAGIVSCWMSRMGSRCLPAAAPPVKASGNDSPLAMCTAFTPGAKVLAEIAAAVA